MLSMTFYLLSFISYKWFLINGISPVIPPRKTQIPTITRNDILPEASRVSMASMNQMQLQVVGVRKSKFYTSIEFYIYQISLSKYSFQNDYSYFSWLHYDCFLSKNANLCDYSIDVQSKWYRFFVSSLQIKYFSDRFKGITFWGFEESSSLLF